MVQTSQTCLLQTGALPGGSYPRLALQCASHASLWISRLWTTHRRPCCCPSRLHATIACHHALPLLTAVSLAIVPFCRRPVSRTLADFSVREWFAWPPMFRSYQARTLFLSRPGSYGMPKVCQTPSTNFRALQSWPMLLLRRPQSSYTAVVFVRSTLLHMRCVVRMSQGNINSVVLRLLVPRSVVIHTVWMVCPLVDCVTTHSGSGETSPNTSHGTSARCSQDTGL